MSGWRWVVGQQNHQQNIGNVWLAPKSQYPSIPTQSVLWHFKASSLSTATKSYDCLPQYSRMAIIGSFPKAQTGRIFRTLLPRAYTLENLTLGTPTLGKCLWQLHQQRLADQTTKNQWAGKYLWWPYTHMCVGVGGLFRPQAPSTQLVWSLAKMAKVDSCVCKVVKRFPMGGGKGTINRAAEWGPFTSSPDFLAKRRRKL